MDDFETLPPVHRPLVPVKGLQERNTDPMAVVQFTQQMRYMAADMLTQGGTTIPEKIGDLVSILNGMDTTAQTTRKLDIEEKTSDNDREAVIAVRQIREMFGHQNPFLAINAEREVSGERVNPMLPPGFVAPEVTFQPGEQDYAETALDVSDFVALDE